MARENLIKASKIPYTLGRRFTVEEVEVYHFRRISLVADEHTTIVAHRQL